MSSIAHRPSEQEIQQQVQHIAAHILNHAVPSRVADIATYGTCLIEQFKPTRAVLVPFYHSFVSVPKNGYTEFMLRFDDDNDAIAAFDDRIAIAVATQIMKVAHS